MKLFKTFSSYGEKMGKTLHAITTVQNLQVVKRVEVAYFFDT